MTRYLVTPDDAGSGWVVKYSSGRTVSSHRTKANAMQAARKKASSGDTITKYLSSGRVQGNQTVR